MIPTDKKIIDYERLARYHDNLNDVLKTKQDIITDIEDVRYGSTLGLTSIQTILNYTYSELKNLRDNNNLIPGQQYRIIDYETKTKQSDAYSSAGHQFDIIVTADSNNTLNEYARAIQHEGDTYFADSNLSAWRLKYKLDNDTTYMWVDSSCKGVIYEMTDEFNNTFCYDFKNILQPRFKLTNTGSDLTNNKYFGWYGHNNMDSNDYIMCYTFSSDDNLNEDLSLNKTIINGNKVIVKNVKLPYLYKNGDSKYPNDIIFLHTQTDVTLEEWSNIQFGDQCYNGTISSHCYSIKIGNNCKNFIFNSNNREVEILDYSRDFMIGHGCYDYQIASNCNEYTINSYCYSFKIGNECNKFTIGENCKRFNVSNYCREFTCGSNCQIWSCGNNCSNWSCGNGCSFWSCGEQTYNWSCGDSCSSWKAGNSCPGWSCGNNCSYWSCGNECSGWTVGNDCSGWSCGNNCKNWKTGVSSTNWSVGNNCSGWSCGIGCYNWSCGNGCYNWHVGNYCCAWRAAENVHTWYFGGENQPKDYFSTISIESNNHNFCLNVIYTTSSSKICRGIHINEMAFVALNGYTNYSLTETNGNVNQLFQTIIGKSGDKKLTVS